MMEGYIKPNKMERFLQIVTKSFPRCGSMISWAIVIPSLLIIVFLMENFTNIQYSTISSYIFFGITFMPSVILSLYLEKLALKKLKYLELKRMKQMHSTN